MEIYLAENLSLLRKRRKRTQDDVAFTVNIKRSTYTGIEVGNSKPSIEVLIALSNYFGIAIDTLLKIDLSKLSEFQLSELERGNDVYIRGSQLRILSKTTDRSNNENIELVPEKAKAGYVTGYADPEYIHDLPRFQLPFLSPNRKYRSFQISGDSMLPIPEGAWITGDFVQDWYSIQSGKAYIILTQDDGVVFKVVDNLIQDEGILRLYSLNPLYKPYDVKVTDIREVWRFVNFISSEIPNPSNPDEMMREKLLDLTREVEQIKRQISKT
ncbi:MAG: LexA family transcriptional regulator [Bacteroidota bacterium]|nr:LexA family transcriptional regulator [Bacteroidota bacterium]